MIQTALNAAEANCCAAYYPYRLVFGAAQAKHPCLELYRDSETIGSLGNTSQRVRTVKVVCTYYAGPVAQDRLDGWAGTLSTRVQNIDDVIEAGHYDTYHGGDNLLEMAGIYECAVDGVAYDYGETGGDLDGAYPSVAITLKMVHRYTRETEGNTALAQIDGSLVSTDSPHIHSGEFSSDTSEQDGDNGKVTATGTFFEAATAAFTTAHVGWYINIADATNTGNNGSHLITARTSGTKVVLGSATTLVNEGPGLHWVLSQRDI
jgi:hypothetical protein